MNIKVNICNIRNINSFDKRVIDIINEIHSGKSLYESVSKYDSFNMVINGSIDSIRLLGVFLDMQKRFKRQLVFSMFYPCFMNLLLALMFVFVSKFFDIYVNIVYLIISILINVLLSAVVIYKLFTKLRFIEHICIWIYVVRGLISIKAASKLNIDIMNYNNINAISYALFQCNNIGELEGKYQDEHTNVESYFKISIQIISSLSIVIIGINLCFVILNVSNRHLLFNHR